MGRALGKCGAERKCMVVFVEKSKGKRPFEKPRRRWEYNIQMDIQGIGERA